MENKKIITLTTDFGPSSVFVGIMKGVIKSIIPDCEIIDISHSIEPQNILEAAFTIEKAFRFFPEGSIHVVVVDPGVGTKRRAIAVSSQRHIFIGPDNGVLSWVLNRKSRIFHIKNDAIFLKPVSKTFHGRDIFAPSAAFVARGLPLISLGPQIHDPYTIKKPSVNIKGNIIEGKIILKDSFGNLITSIEEKHTQTASAARQNNKWFVTLEGLEEKIYVVESFEQAKNFKLAAIFDSFNHLEIFSFASDASKIVKNWKNLKVKLYV